MPATKTILVSRLTILKEPKDANWQGKFFNSEKGFGFIRPDDGSDDVFVHITAVQRSGLEGLKDDQAVSYELTEGRDGRMAAGDIALAD